MPDNRIEPRLFCADLVEVHWKDQKGHDHRGWANLEDISRSGACLQLEHPLAFGTPVRIAYPNGELVGKVRYCAFREIGYFLGVEFEQGNRWSQRGYKPRYLLDPRALLSKLR